MYFSEFHPVFSFREGSSRALEWCDCTFAHRMAMIERTQRLAAPGVCCCGRTPASRLFISCCAHSPCLSHLLARFSDHKVDGKLDPHRGKARVFHTLQQSSRRDRAMSLEWILIVVSGGEACCASSVSSKPMTLTSSGTRRSAPPGRRARRWPAGRLRRTPR